jgi:hypothetical protein
MHLRKHFVERHREHDRGQHLYDDDPHQEYHVEFQGELVPHQRVRGEKADGEGEQCGNGRHEYRIEEIRSDPPSSTF